MNVADALIDEVNLGATEQFEQLAQRIGLDADGPSGYRSAFIPGAAYGAHALTMSVARRAPREWESVLERMDADQ